MKFLTAANMAFCFSIEIIEEIICWINSEVLAVKADKMFLHLLNRFRRRHLTSSMPVVSDCLEPILTRICRYLFARLWP